MTNYEFVCPFCGRITVLALEDERVARYEAGELAQDAFDSLSATERETIISGLCEHCQREIFGK